MNKIQDLWAEDYGSVLQMKIVNPISSEIFNEVVEYLQQVDVVEVDASRHLFYIQDKYIFIFYTALNHNPNSVLDKIKNHFRTCKNTLHLSDYELAITETDKVGDCFNDWLLKAIDELDKDNIVNDKVIEKENNELQELNDAYNKQADLLTRMKEERKNKILEDKNKKQTINEIKDKKLQLIENIERGKSQLVKSVINEFFKITNDKKDCVSKKVFCDMLNLDHKSKIDIRFLSNILKEHGIEYNRIKIIKGITGAYFGIKLMD